MTLSLTCATGLNRFCAIAGTQRGCAEPEGKDSSFHKVRAHFAYFVSQGFAYCLLPEPVENPRKDTVNPTLVEGSTLVEDVYRLLMLKSTVTHSLTY